MNKTSQKTYPYVPGIFRRELLTWYDAHRRELPWRGAVSPYATIVSEFMLQQTRVETAAPYFERWMRRFPTVSSLADAAEDDVLHAWAGLGYYSRARNLRRLASELVEHHGGEVPSDLDALNALPGVGAYTAAAVASIAFGVPEPALDANVRRVMSRIGAIGGDVKSAEVTKRIEQLARLLIDPVRPGDFNQALMDLGATICLPRPDCKHCPVEKRCVACRTGCADAFPQIAPRRRTVHVESAAALVVRRGRVLIRRRPEGEPMANLWELPGGAVEAGETPSDSAVRILRDQTGLSCEALSESFSISHTFTHHRIRIHVVECELIGPIPRSRSGVKWILQSGPNEVPLTGATMKILKLLRQ